MKKHGVTLKSEGAGLLRFGLVGCFGFFVDGAFLWFGIKVLGLDAISARCFSLLIAISATWAFNRRFTFRSDNPNWFQEWSRYVVASACGAAMNFLTYTFVLSHWPSVTPGLALFIGSLVGVVFNYCGSRFFAFQSSHLQKTRDVRSVS